MTALFCMLCKNRMRHNQVPCKNDYEDGHNGNNCGGWIDIKYIMVCYRAVNLIKSGDKNNWHWTSKKTNKTLKFQLSLHIAHNRLLVPQKSLSHMQDIARFQKNCYNTWLITLLPIHHIKQTPSIKMKFESNNKQWSINVTTKTC